MPDNEEILFSGIVDFEAKGVDDVLADAARVEKAISGLDATANVDVAVDAAEVDSALLALENLNDDASLKVNVDDSEIGTANADLQDLSEDQNAKANVDDSDIEEAKALLEQLRTLSVINIALNLPAGAADILGRLEALPGVGQVFDNQRAEAVLTAQSGTLNPEELATAQGLYTDALFESTQEAALFLNQLKALGVAPENLDATARSALAARDAFTAMGKEADLNQIAVAQNALVLNDLADDATEASDLIAAGVLSGADRRDDFLDTLIEYSSAFKDLGFNGEQTLNAINSGIDAGFDNSDRIADLFREFNIRASNPEETAAQDTLKALGLGDEAAAFQAGELSGAEFFKGVVAAIQAEPDAGVQQQYAANIFGTQAEDFGVQTALGVDPVTATFDTIEGRAAEVQTLLNDNIGTAFTELFNTINLEAGNLLTSDAIDLDGKLEAIKTAVQTTVDAIQAGESVSDAIKIGLEPLGFDDEFSKLESIFGNLVIGFLQIVADVQDILGKDSSGTRAEVTRLGQQQLEFDLQLTNPEDITDAIAIARERGVADEIIGQQVTDAVAGALGEGNVTQAQAIATGAGSATQTVGTNFGLFSNFVPGGNLIAGAQAEVPVDLGIDTGALQEEIDMAAGDLRSQFAEAFQSGDIGLAVELANQLGDPILLGTVNTVAESMRDNFEAALTSGDWGTAINIAEALPGDEEILAAAQEQKDLLLSAFSLSEQMGNTGNAQAIADLLPDQDLQARVDAMKGIVDTAATDVSVAADSMAAATEDADARIATALTDGTVTTSFEDAAAIIEATTDNMGEAIESFATSVEEVDDKIASLLANMGAAFASLSGDIAGAVVNFQGQVGSSTTLNVNQTINTTSGAQAAAAANLTVDGLRGFAP